MTDHRPGAWDLNLEIDHASEDAGWIDCYLTFDGICHKFDASDVFPPFIQLIHFIRAIAANRLPYDFYWDEEGHGAEFEAWPVADDSPNFRLKIFYDKDKTIWADAVLERKAVVEVLLAALRDYALYSRPPSRGDWEFSLADVIAFDEFHQRTIPPRSNPAFAEPIKMNMLRFHPPNEICQLEIEVWGIPVKRLILPDSDPRWPELFDWLEKILRGQFPAEKYLHDLRTEMMYRRMIARGGVPDSILDKPLGNIFRAVAVDHPRHFRLVVIPTDHKYPDYIEIDEVQDRFTFVGAFCTEFERMLTEEYQVVPDEYGTVFDLHNLPLERLKALLAEHNSE